MDRIAKIDVPELRARIELVARNGDSQKSLIESFDAKLDAIAAKNELSAAVINKAASDIAMLLAGLGASIGRIGGRAPRKEKAP